MVDPGVRRLLVISSGYLLATLLLVALRYNGMIAWGWPWVLCPLWLPIVLASIGFGSFLMVRLIAPGSQSGQF
jgi:hypothetical protein